MWKKLALISKALLKEFLIRYKDYPTGFESVQFDVKMVYVSLKGINLMYSCTMNQKRDKKI